MDSKDRIPTYQVVITIRITKGNNLEDGNVWELPLFLMKDSAT